MLNAVQHPNDYSYPFVLLNSFQHLWWKETPNQVQGDKGKVEKTLKHVQGDTEGILVWRSSIETLLQEGTLCCIFAPQFLRNVLTDR